MPVNVIDTLKPKNNGSFPVVEAVDVSVSDDLRLPEALDAKADASDLETTNAAVATKADASAVATATAELQGEIDQIVISASAESVVAPEVAQARVDFMGIPHSTLKGRLDADEAAIGSELTDLSASVRGSSEETAIPSSGTYGIVKDTDGYITYSPSSVYESKKYSIPQGAKKVRIKTTAYDSSAYYTSQFYVYFSNGTAVTGKAISYFPSKQEVDVTLFIPENSNTVWVVSRYKMDSEDQDEMQHTNECYSVVYGGGLETDVSILKPEVSELRYNLMHIDEGLKNSIIIGTENGKLIQNVAVGNDWTEKLSNDDNSVYTISAYHFDAAYVGKTLSITVSSYNSSSTRCFGFCDENNIVSAVYTEKSAPWVHNTDGTYTLNIRIDTEYFFLSLKSSSSIINTKILDEVIKNAITDISTLQSDISEINYTLLHLSDEKKIEISIPTENGFFIQQANIGDDWTNELVSDSGSVYTPVSFDFDSGFVGKTLEITVSSYASNSTRCLGFCDENNIVIKSYTEKGVGWVENSDGTFTASIPIESSFFFMSLKSSSTVLNEIVSLRLLEVEDSFGYVSPNGSDENDGYSMATAFATVSKALESGRTRIILAGGKYAQQIDMSNANGKHIEIECFDRTSRPVFVDENCVISESADLNDGVYSCSITQTLSTGNSWLYLDGVADEGTEITDSERMPLQRGKQYRCDDTRIIKCSAITLADALDEMRESEEYKWFEDDGMLYFTAPSSPTSEHPVCCSNGNSLFLNANRSISLTMNGVECKYLSINAKNMCDVFLSDCKASNVFGWGAITFDSTLNAKFLRCEAARCVNATNGDGFNADVSNTGEPFAKHYTVTLLDCWSHDNADDGYSCHRRSESTIIGGLFEYNGKAGVTPSYGEHCNCYSVYSRQNYCGFFLTGEAEVAEGGKYSQMQCFNCVAENNNRGGLHSGFAVNGEGNKMILVACKAISNRTSYYVENDSYAKIVDCTTFDATTIIGGSDENVTIIASTLVTNGGA